MLTILIPDAEYYNNESLEFFEIKGKEITLEHSLKSISKWESKWKKPFLTDDKKTVEECLDYIKCMCLTPNVKDELYSNLTRENVNSILDYIDDSMSATIINNGLVSKTSKKEVITSELIYYWMVALNIPFECEKWHINRLFNLIEICNIKNGKPKKKSRKEILNEYSSLNAKRKAELNTKG